MQRLLTAEAEAEAEKASEKATHEKERANRAFSTARENQTLITAIGKFLLPILGDIETHAPQIQQATYHDIVSQIHITPVSDGSGHKTPFKDHLSVALRWGQKGQLTAEEQTLIERYRNLRLPLLRRGHYPESITAASYDYIGVGVVVGASLMALSWREPKNNYYDNLPKVDYFVGHDFLQNPSMIIPDLAKAMQSPLHRQTVILRKNGYQ